MRETEYGDAVILALREEYQKKQSEQLPVEQDILIGTDRVPLYKAILFDRTCSMMLPETLTDMDFQGRIVKYPGKNRPPVIKTDRDGDATISFSLLPEDDEEKPDNVSERLLKLRDDMRKVWKQNVFYDCGEVMADGIRIAWMDFRAYCLDKNLYSIIFMFASKGQIVLGNFHCGFPQYDLWKHVILKLLSTMKNERN